MALEATGTLHAKFDTQVISDRFKKREFVIEMIDGAYKQHIKFQATQDRCEIVDNYKVGQEIKVHFNLRGRPYQKGNETIYFTNLEAWRIESVGTQEQAPQQQERTPEPVASDGEMGDDLPF